MKYLAKIIILYGFSVGTLFSNSGETGEIVELMPYLKNKGTLQIAIVGQKNSRDQLRPRESNF